MTDRPILFSAPMIRALIAEATKPGTGKTQTRRLLKPQPDEPPGFRPPIGFSFMSPPRHYEMRGWTEETGPLMRHRPLPFWNGDRLWVRETWAVGACADGLSPSMLSPGFWNHDNGGCWYAAGGEPAHPVSPRSRKWRPGIFMPRWASRLTLTVTNVRVERLQDISEKDAKAEGISQWHQDVALGSERLSNNWCRYSKMVQEQRGIVKDCACDLGAFAMLWDSINGGRKGAAWADNPWIVAVTFRPELRNIDIPARQHEERAAAGEVATNGASAPDLEQSEPA